jgi:hypothetical protein
LFGLHRIPEGPPANYRRLSRYDETGLIWLLRGRPVATLTDATAAIKNPTGAVTIYRRYDKPALGPPGDSLDDLLRDCAVEKREARDSYFTGRRCDYCGCMETRVDKLNGFDWPGWPDGILLHKRCEYPWLDSANQGGRHPPANDLEEF